MIVSIAWKVIVATVGPEWGGRGAARKPARPRLSGYQRLADSFATIASPIWLVDTGATPS